MRIIPRVCSLLLVVALIGACSVQLKTATQRVQGCDMALATGRLVADPRSGLGIGTTGGETIPVLWPFGYSARRDATGIVLVDDSGGVIAHEGQAITMGGGNGADGLWHACAGSIRVAAPAPS
jgi:hypothetical protein